MCILLHESWPTVYPYVCQPCQFAVLCCSPVAVWTVLPLSGGVFGETVSVIDGDSVTLHTGLTKIQEDDVLEWRFGAGRDRIVRARKDSDPKYDDVLGGRFRDRLKLDRQTGDLTITNIKTEHTGLYEISINAIALRTFTVNVVPGVDEVKSVSVTVGYSVTLNSGTNIQRDDVMEWRFADLNSPIAEHNIKTGNYLTSDGPDGIFGHRLQLDYSTGSLTIWNIGTKHSGLYEAVIRKSSSGYTVHQSYSVTVTGERKPALVMKGYSVTLHTDLTEIQRDDLMQWMFENTVIAEIIKAQNKTKFATYDGSDGRFRNRLELDKKNGSLIITDTRTEDSGHYELKISSSRFTINKRISVTVSDPDLSAGAIAGIVIGVLLAFAAVAAVAVAGVIYQRHRISELKEWFNKGRIRSVKEGEPVTLNLDVTLNPNDTDVHKDDTLVWTFRSARIAQRNSGAGSFTVHDDGPDGRFKDRLKLNPQTGSLTITDTRTTDTGLYELVIIRPGKSSVKRFSVSVFGVDETNAIETKPVNEGKSVTLETGVTDIQTVGQILWKFGYTPLAKIKKGKKKISPSADGMFKGRLKLDQTGSLTINKIKPTDAGIYMLYKIEKGNIQRKLFRVSVSVNNSEDVPLTTVYG